ncbi:MAG: hypothetical protein V4501_08335 [Pseudomonadota bacterium]
MKICQFLVFFIMLAIGELASAARFSMFESKYASLVALPAANIEQLVKTSIDTSPYREIKAQVIYGRALTPDHVLVFLFTGKKHRVDMARIDVNAHFKKIAVVENYAPADDDFEQQPELAPLKCPDPAIQFIVFAPNDNKYERVISKNVAQYAREHSLKVASFIGETATRQNYLNAMTCPQLKGNFYVGDGTPHLITTYDGIISAIDIQAFLTKKFQFKVVNIWVACNSYRKPMLPTMLVAAQSQKYAAGISDLAVGPSDRTAACAMMAAIDGKPMTAAFRNCYQNYDNRDDRWGFAGYGSDYFGI